MLLCPESRYAECRYAECRYAECRYAECRYAECRSTLLGAQHCPQIDKRSSLAIKSLKNKRFYDSATRGLYYEKILL